jgi:NAD(P)-dependent dehydrogenase (short-subunit alcohol dehydrogenase family)
MSNRKIWFITGAGRGMGVDFAKAALAAGHAVVASQPPRWRWCLPSRRPGTTRPTCD